MIAKPFNRNFLVILIASSCGNAVPDRVNSSVVSDDSIEEPLQDSAQSGYPDSIFHFQEINDSIIFSEIYGDDLEYSEEKNTWMLLGGYLSDTSYVEKMYGTYYTTENDSLYALKVYSNEIYYNCNVQFDSYFILLRKEKREWLVTEHYYGIEEDPETIYEYVKGPYFIIETVYSGSHCWGMFSAGTNYSIYYEGKEAATFSFRSDENNTGSACAFNENNEENWDCTCYQVTGTGELNYDAKKKVLTFTSKEITTDFGGKDCEEKYVSEISEVTEVCYKKYKGILSQVSTKDGKRTVLKKQSLEEFLKSCGGN